MLNSTLTVVLIASVSLPNAPRFLDLASRAGRSVSARVFQTQVSGDVEQRCQAEADRERQICLQEGGTQCDELYETRFATCLAAPPTHTDTGGGKERSRTGSIFMWIGIGVVTVGLIALVAAVTGKSEEEKNLETLCRENPRSWLCLI